MSRYPVKGLYHEMKHNWNQKIPVLGRFATDPERFTH
jgi:hypothetical protein